MNFKLVEIHSGCFVARDMFNGWRLTNYRELAEIFRHISEGGRTVPDILEALRKKPEYANWKLTLGVVRL